MEKQLITQNLSSINLLQRQLFRLKRNLKSIQKQPSEEIRSQSSMLFNGIQSLSSAVNAVNRIQIKTKEA